MQATKEPVLSLIDKSFEIPSIPLVLVRIIQALDKDTSSAAELEDLILHDPALSARILRLANSAFYSFRARVKTISHAISLLGMNIVTSLAIGINLFEPFTKKMKYEGTLISKLWTHSFGVGVLSKEIWTRRSNEKEGEFAFLCGLLHDLGKVVFFKTDPAAYSTIFSLKKSETDPAITSYEAEHYGADHTAVGEALAKQWGFPPDLICVIRHHHDESFSDAPLVSAVTLADLLAKKLEIGYDGDGGVYANVSELHSRLDMSSEEYERLTVFATCEHKNIRDFFHISS